MKLSMEIIYFRQVIELFIAVYDQFCFCKQSTRRKLNWIFQFKKSGYACQTFLDSCL